MKTTNSPTPLSSLCYATTPNIIFIAYFSFPMKFHKIDDIPYFSVL